MALLELFDAWAKASDSGGTQIRILLLDFRKAFDLIDHNILLAKLTSYGVPAVLLRWIHAFLQDRKQCIKIGMNATSAWGKVHGGVPQGTKLGPLLFITMINDMELLLPAVKYVDDTTMYDIQRSPTAGKLQCDALQEAAIAVHKWTQANNMVLNPEKTKELFVCFSKNPDVPRNISISDVTIKMVNSALLLGVTISRDLKWQEHIDNIYDKAAFRVYSLCMLKHAGVSQADLVGIYIATLRPLLEYACQVWHPGLTVKQCNTLESVQRRAMRIIFPNLDYIDALKVSGLPTLKERRTLLCRTLFENMQNSEHRLNHLLPVARNNDYNLRRILKYELPKCSTNRYKNTFVPYCLYNFQK